LWLEASSEKWKELYLCLWDILHNEEYSYKNMYIERIKILGLSEIYQGNNKIFFKSINSFENYLDEGFMQIYRVTIFLK
jgi:hypothetical protein